ncbi:DNA polymerase [Shimia sp.]|uniref:DNA polymerase n=1 Tax=Shimia sp. TaxID=1954381 RepID=UPI003BAC5C39
MQDVDTGEVFSYHGKYIHIGVDMLMKADFIIGHNIIKFDIPAIQKIYPDFEVAEFRVIDTLVCSRLIWPNIQETDLKRIRGNKTQMPMKLAGSHGLEAWGWRLDNWKGDYAKEMEAEGLDPWANWSQEMQDYCEQDVEVTKLLFQKIEEKEYSQQALQLEHEVAFICAQQERNGFGFNQEAADQLYHELTLERVELEEELQGLFEPWWVKNGTTKTYKRTTKMKTGEYREAGNEYQPVKLQVFNPGSRDHIADRLKRVRGWKPKEMTESGKPKVDETILNSLPYPEAKQLAKYFQVKKVLGQLGDGQKAWIKYATNNRIHGSINTNGAVTGRATHSHPNLAQVPSVRAYRGKECRALFGPICPDHVQIGCDVSGLELRMLAHFMARYDNGAYGDVVVNGDIHTENQRAAGLPSRDNAKTFIYGFLYGAGDAKIGEIVGAGSKRGRALKQRFLKSLPALKDLIDGVKKAANTKGYLKGLDGRQLHVRSDHAALNVLLQSAGALVCKRWLVEFHQLLRENNLHNVVYQMAWIHDEVQLSVPKEYSTEVGDLCVKAIEKTQEYFNIRVPLTGEYIVGNNWKECH